jgi:hypothetical protein
VLVDYEMYLSLTQQLNIKVMKASRNQLIHPRNVRQALGILGIVFPFVLALGVYVYDDCELQPSISHFYHTVMGNVFVGFLCAYAMFLYAYRGYDERDSRAANLAATLAIITALVPTDLQKGYEACVHAPWFTNQIIHLSAAGSFFVVLSYISIKLFRETDNTKQPTLRKLTRNKIYLVCGIGMLACLGAIALYFWICGQYPEWKALKLVFWFEALALLLFGISWLVKGELVFSDVKSDG